MCKDCQPLQEKYSIAWIKVTAARGKLIEQKVPFLAAIVQDIDHIKADASSVVTVTLRDPTG